MSKFTRREFLKTGGLALAGLTIAPSSILGKSHGHVPPDVYKRQLLLHLHHDLILELHIRVIDSNSCHLIVGRKQFDIEMNFLLLGHHRPSLINQEFHFYLCHIYQYLLHHKKIRVHLMYLAKIMSYSGHQV